MSFGLNIVFKIALHISFGRFHASTWLYCKISQFQIVRFRLGNLFSRMYNWDFLSELYAASISSSLQQKSKSVRALRSEKAPYFGGIDGTTL